MGSVPMNTPSFKMDEFMEGLGWAGWEDEEGLKREPLGNPWLAPSLRDVARTAAVSWSFDCSLVAFYTEHRAKWRFQ